MGTRSPSATNGATHASVFHDHDARSAGPALMAAYYRGAPESRQILCRGVRSRHPRGVSPPCSRPRNGQDLA